MDGTANNSSMRHYRLMEQGRPPFWFHALQDAMDKATKFYNEVELTWDSANLGCGQIRSLITEKVLDFSLEYAGTFTTDRVNTNHPAAWLFFHFIMKGQETQDLRTFDPLLLEWDAETIVAVIARKVI